jgi:acetyltransferase-like isoleucine patch superfamily enzyme
MLKAIRQLYDRGISRGISRGLNCCLKWLYPSLQKIIKQEVARQLAEQQEGKDEAIRRLQPLVAEIINTQVRIWGDHDRLTIAPTAELVNTLLNTASGYITIGEYTFTGHDVSILTGSHDYKTQMAERLSQFPKSGRDITIGKGVWIGSGAMILGPCQIGDHAVIAAGAVVVGGSIVPEGAIMAGIPAKLIKQIKN